MEFLQETLRESVRKLANIGESHFLKGALSLKRFHERFGWNEEMLSVLKARSKWQEYPLVQGQFSPLVNKQAIQPTPQMAKRMIGRGMFPQAYFTSFAWYQQEGLEAIIMSFRDRAIHEMSYLGHSWSVWCSFFEIIQGDLTEEDRLYTLERFVEFAAKTFPGYPTSDSKWVPPVQEDPGPLHFSEVLDQVLEKPGFYGHHLLTLGYLYRHQSLLEEREWNVGLHEVKRMTEKVYIDNEDNVWVPRDQVQITVVTEEDLLESIQQLLQNGPKDLHALTVADISYDIWQVADDRQRNHLLAFLQSLT
ncbi:hypothetical protein [Ammoniphilus sp. YIM 78166]|uniref:hypothetical protein n=1 Tax=Ammoniphilus sp. YIM 78166 TaxID=1644106 RepID=UPI00106F4BCD|nr:hypothetical protein [Ammoniphilus sp. YIM 78166]